MKNILLKLLVICTKLLPTVTRITPMKLNLSINHKVFKKDKFSTNFKEKFRLRSPFSISIHPNIESRDSIKLKNNVDVFSTLELKEKNCIKKSTGIFSVNILALNCNNSLSIFGLEENLKKLILKKKIFLNDENLDCFNFYQISETEAIIVCKKIENGKKLINLKILKNGSYSVNNLGEFEIDDFLGYNIKNAIIHTNKKSQYFFIMLKNSKEYKEKIILRLINIKINSQKLIDLGDQKFDFNQKNENQTDFIGMASKNQNFILIFSGKTKIVRYKRVMEVYFLNPYTVNITLDNSGSLDKTQTLRYDPYSKDATRANYLPKEKNFLESNSFLYYFTFDLISQQNKHFIYHVSFIEKKGVRIYYSRSSAGLILKNGEKIKKLGFLQISENGHFYIVENEKSGKKEIQYFDKNGNVNLNYKDEIIKEVETAVSYMDQFLVVFSPENKVFLLQVNLFSLMNFKIDANFLPDNGKLKFKLNDKISGNKLDVEYDFDVVDNRFGVLDTPFDGDETRKTIPLVDQSYISLNNLKLKKKIYKNFFNFFGNLHKAKILNSDEKKISLFQGFEFDFFSVLGVDSNKNEISASFPSFFIKNIETKGFKILGSCDFSVKFKKMNCRSRSVTQLKNDFKIIKQSTHTRSSVDSKFIEVTYFAILKTSFDEFKILRVINSFNLEKRKFENVISAKTLKSDKLKHICSPSFKVESGDDRLILCSDDTCDLYKLSFIGKDSEINVNLKIKNQKIWKFGKNSKIENIYSIQRGQIEAGFIFKISYELGNQKRFYFATIKESKTPNNQKSFFKIIFFDDEIENNGNFEIIEGGNIIVDRSKQIHRMLSFTLKKIKIDYFYDLRLKDFKIEKIEKVKKISKNLTVVSGFGSDSEKLKVVVLNTNFMPEAYGSYKGSNNLNNLKFYEEFNKNFILKSSFELSSSELYLDVLDEDYLRDGVFVLNFWDSDKKKIRSFLRATNENLIFKTGRFDGKDELKKIEIEFSSFNSEKVVKFEKEVFLQIQSFDFWVNKTKKFPIRLGKNYLEDIFKPNFIKLEIDSLVPSPLKDKKKIPYLSKKLKKIEEFSGLVFTRKKFLNYLIEEFPIKGQERGRMYSMRIGNKVVKKFEFKPPIDLKLRFITIGDVYFEQNSNSTFFSFLECRAQSIRFVDYFFLTIFVFDENIVEKNKIIRKLKTLSLRPEKHEAYLHKFSEDEDFYLLIITKSSFKPKYWVNKHFLIFKISKNEEKSEIMEKVKIDGLAYVQSVLRFPNWIIIIVVKANTIIEYRITLEEEKLKTRVKTMEMLYNYEILSLKCREFVREVERAHCVIDYKFFYDVYVNWPLGKNETKIELVSKLKQGSKSGVSGVFPDWVIDERIDYFDLSDGVLVRIKFGGNYYSEIGLKVWDLKEIREKKEKSLEPIETKFDDIIPKLGFSTSVVVFEESNRTSLSFIELTRNISFWEGIKLLYNSSINEYIYVPSLKYLYLNLETIILRVYKGKGNDIQEIFFNEIFEVEHKKKEQKNDFRSVFIIIFVALFGLVLLSMIVFFLLKKFKMKKLREKLFGSENSNSDDFGRKGEVEELRQIFKKVKNSSGTDEEEKSSSLFLNENKSSNSDQTLDNSEVLSSGSS